MIRVHDDATTDLIEIRAKDPEGFKRLIALIEQLKVDAGLISKLLDHGFGDDKTEPISVMKWISVQRRENLPIWRVKAWDLERQRLKYRIIYCFNWPDRSHNIMAIIPRDQIDYDDQNHPIRKRVIERVREEFPDA